MSQDPNFILIVFVDRASSDTGGIFLIKITDKIIKNIIISPIFTRCRYLVSFKTFRETNN